MFKSKDDKIAKQEAMLAPTSWKSCLKMNIKAVQIYGRLKRKKDDYFFDSESILQSLFG